MPEAAAGAEPSGSGSAEDSAGSSEPRPVEPRRLPWRGIGAVILAAAAIAAVLLIPRDRVSEELAELGRVTQPPVYLGVPVRQAPARPDSVFAEAMSAYVAEEYAAAATGLEEALMAGAGSVPAEFFRGASLLMLGRPDEAERAFSAIIEAGDSPYLAEAHYYRAKALLSLGRASEALQELEAAVNSEGDIRTLASALADSVEVEMGG